MMARNGNRKEKQYKVGEHVECIGLGDMLALRVSSLVLGLWSGGTIGNVAVI